jgi:hypothetical protein
MACSWDRFSVDDVAIGIRYENVDSVVDAGAVHVIYGSVVGLNATAVLLDQSWAQDSKDVVEANDFWDLAF